MSEWQNLDKIFVDEAYGFGNADEGFAVITKDYIKNGGKIASFSQEIIKPVDNIAILFEDFNGITPLLWKERLTFYSDGTMDRVYLYNRYPSDVKRTINNKRPALTPWAQTIMQEAIFEERRRIEAARGEDW